MKQAFTCAIAGLALILGGCPADPPPPPTPPIPATVKAFSANPTAVAAGDSTVLSWDVENATSVVIRRPDGSVVPLPDPTQQRGSVDVKVDTTTVFVLTARGAGGSDSAAASVSVASSKEEPLFSAVPEEILAGDQSALVWHIPGATQVTVTDSAGGTVYSGDQATHTVMVNPAFDTTYTLTAGSITAEVTIEVETMVGTFTASALAVRPGDKVTFNWSVGGAEEVVLSAAGRGDLFTTTMPSALLDGSYEDTVPASQPANTRVTYTLTAKKGSKVFVRNVVVNVSVDPVFTSSDIPPFALENGSLFVKWTTALADQVQVLVDDQVVYQAPALETVQDGGVVLPWGTTSQTVMLRATNVRGGASVVEKVVEPVGLPAFVSFSADQTSIAGGTRVTLSWDVTNARHVRVVARDLYGVTDVVGATAGQGTAEVYPNQTTEFILTADNTVGNAIPPQSVVVKVTQPALLEFNLQPIPAGVTTRLTGHSIPGGTEILGLPSVVKNDPSAQFVDISATGAALTGTIDQVITLPDTFFTIVFGTPVFTKSIYVSQYGVINLDGNDRSPSSINDPFPDNSLFPLSIVPYWDDIDYDQNGGKIFYQLDGFGPTQRLIVQWEKAQLDDDTASEMTFQAQIYADGRIVFAYKTLASLLAIDGTIGVINHDETEFVVPSDTPVSGDTYTFFAHQPSLPLDVKATVLARHARVVMPGGKSLDVNVNPALLDP
ncbi:MAG: hypothetical protein WBV82_07235, partial [Myxococcaceae bacterium]